MKIECKSCRQVFDSSPETLRQCSHCRATMRIPSTAIPEQELLATMLENIQLLRKDAASIRSQIFVVAIAVAVSVVIQVFAVLSTLH